jgi:hypothetical protein
MTTMFVATQKFKDYTTCEVECTHVQKCRGTDASKIAFVME